MFTNNVPFIISKSLKRQNFVKYCKILHYFLVIKCKKEKLEVLFSVDSGTGSCITLSMNHGLASARCTVVLCVVDGGNV